MGLRNVAAGNGLSNTLSCPEYSNQLNWASGAAFTRTPGCVICAGAAAVGAVGAAAVGAWGAAAMGRAAVAAGASAVATVVPVGAVAAGASAVATVVPVGAVAAPAPCALHATAHAIRASNPFTARTQMTV